MPPEKIQQAYEQASSQNLEDYLPSPIRLACGEEPNKKEHLLERAYRLGFCGSFGPSDDNPSWARKIARYEKDQLKANARCTTRAEDIIASDRQGIGKGKRAVHWGHYMQRTRKAFYGGQDYGNCVMWALRAIMGAEWCADITLRGEAQVWIERIGTALGYGSRGHRGQGTYGGTMVRVAHLVGIQLEQAYCNGDFDFSEERIDEWWGNYWGGRGGPPKCLKEEVKNDRLDQFAWVTEMEAAVDLLYDGHFGMHGSNYTAYTNGKLVSRLRRIGGHEQAVIGYDDTDEFRDWYYKKTGEKITGPVFIHDQSWNNWNQFSDDLWPDHLWGEYRPQGVWVIRANDFRRIMNQWNDLIFVNNIIGFEKTGPVKHCPTCTCEIAA